MTHAPQFNSITTLAEIFAAGPCKDGWEKLLAHLGKTNADDEPLPLMTILDRNGLDDALWCLRVPSLERLSRHFQAWCAEQVLHMYEAKYPGDFRVRDQIAMLRNDGATMEERAAAAAEAEAADAAAAAAWTWAEAADAASAWDAAAAAAAAEAAAAARAAAAAVARAAAAARAAQERHLRTMIAS